MLIFCISIIYTYARGGMTRSVRIITPNIIQEDFTGKSFIFLFFLYTVFTRKRTAYYARQILSCLFYCVVCIICILADFMLVITNVVISDSIVGHDLSTPRYNCIYCNTSILLVYYVRFSEPPRSIVDPLDVERSYIF